MSWIWYSSKACFLSGSEGDMILQEISQTAGTQYIVRFDITGLVQGKIKLNNYEESYEFTTSGSYAVIGTAVNGTLVFTAEYDDTDLLPFGACIDNVRVLAFGDQEALACSPCISVKEVQDDCFILVEASDSGNNLNFDWTDLVLTMRVNAKFARVDYNTKKEAFDDNGGDYLNIYFDGKKNRNLLIQSAPVFIHDFLYMCMGIGSLSFNGVEYVIVEDEYPNITWNKTLTEGTVELKVRKRNYKLNRTNCE